MPTYQKVELKITESASTEFKATHSDPAMASVDSPTDNPHSSSMDEHIHVFWHEGMLKHDTGRGVFDTDMDPGFLDVLENHPENSDRVKNMVSILKRGPISPFISWHQGRPALTTELLSFHTQDYINELVEAEKNGGKIMCSGTFLNPGSWDAALLAAGTTLSAMKHIIDGLGKISYALVQPPGHHAQPTQADGYCFLNNAGLAVQLALDSGQKKVVVIDTDVHYGNGTAEGFYRSNRVLTISLHMNHGSWGPSHPQNGAIDELGEGEGFGYNLNVPLPNGTGDKGYVNAMMELVEPAVDKFEPDVMVLVVGQDSSAFDPNGRQCLTMEGYRRIGQMVHKMAEKHSNGRLLIVQEGGYHVTYSAYCLHATLEGVLNLPVPLLADPIAYYPEEESFSTAAVESIKKYHGEFVPFLNYQNSQLSFTPESQNTDGALETQNEDDGGDEDDGGNEDEEVDTSQQRGAKKKRNTQKWSVAEDEALISAYMNTNQMYEKLWGKVKTAYDAAQQHKPSDLGVRTRSMLKARWRRITIAVNRFGDKYDESFRRFGCMSGYNEQDVIREAVEMYEQEWKKFGDMHAWKMLRRYPEWEERNKIPVTKQVEKSRTMESEPDSGGSGKSCRINERGYSTPTTTPTTDDGVEGGSGKRPMDNKAAKEAKATKRGNSSGGPSATEALEGFTTELQLFQHKKGVNLEHEGKKLEYLRGKEERKKMELKWNILSKLLDQEKLSPEETALKEKLLLELKNY